MMDETVCSFKYEHECGSLASFVPLAGDERKHEKKPLKYFGLEKLKNVCAPK